MSAAERWGRAGLGGRAGASRQAAVSVLLLLSLGVECRAGDPVHEARTAAQGFVDAYLANRGEREAGSPWFQRWAKTMTPNLAGLLESALDAIARHRCEGPPLLEGDLHTAIAEGATAAEVGRCSVQGATARCTVNYTVRHRGDASPYRWSELVGLQKMGGAWRVGDYVSERYVAR